MKNLFADYKTPTMAECEMLGHELALQKRVIQVWYQNARAKEKKGKLAILKASSPSNTDPEQLKQSLESLTSSSSGGKPAEECIVCGFKYSHKCSIQDHIFTKKHIELIKSRIESGKLDPDAGSSGGGKEVAEVVSAAATAPVQGQSASTTSPVCRQISTSPSPNVSVACSTTTVSVASTIPSSTSSLGIPCTASNFMAQLPTDSDSVLNGQQHQQHEKDQAAFLQQLHLLQLATASSTTTTTATHYDSQNNGISSNANTGSTSCNADHPDDDNHDTSSNNVNNTATLSPEDLLQLYGLGGGSSLSPFPALPPSPSSIIASSNNNDSNNEGTTTTPLSSSTSATTSTFSALMQHPLLSNAASALSSSTSSSTTTTSMGTTGK